MGFVFFRARGLKVFGVPCITTKLLVTFQYKNGKPRTPTILHCHVDFNSF